MPPLKRGPISGQADLDELEVPHFPIQEMRMAHAPHHPQGCQTVGEVRVTMVVVRGKMIVVRGDRRRRVRMVHRPVC